LIYESDWSSKFYV